MKALILAAGYARRMLPLTADRAKPLLPVAGVPIVNHLMRNIAQVDEIREVVLVSNHKFVGQFEDWARDHAFGPELRVIDDGSTDEGNRLGAIGDIQFAVDHCELREDLMVVAGDNLFSFSLQAMVDFYRDKGTDVITAYRQSDVERLRRTGVVTLDGDGRVLAFAEKPAEPVSEWAVPPIYLYTAETLGEIPGYLAAGHPPDAPGHLVAWLCARKPVHAFVCDEVPHDIGTLDSYRRVNELLSP